MSETEGTTPAPKSATPHEHELCEAEHPTETGLTCALVGGHTHGQHVAHREGDEPLEQRTVTWGKPVPENEIWVTRPEGLTDNQWLDLEASVAEYIDERVADVVATRPHPAWCKTVGCEPQRSPHGAFEDDGVLHWSLTLDHWVPDELNAQPVSVFAREFRRDNGDHDGVEICAENTIPHADSGCSGVALGVADARRLAAALLAACDLAERD